MAFTSIFRFLLGGADSQCRYIMDNGKRCKNPIQAPSTSYCHLHR